MTLSVDLVPRLGPTVADYPPGSTFGPRDARSYQFVWLLRGSATWRCADTRVSLAPGKLLLIRPGMRDEFHWDPRTATRHAYVHFTLDGLVPHAGNQAHNSPAQLPAGGVAELLHLDSLAERQVEYNPVRETDRRLASRNLDPPTYAPHFRRGTLAPTEWPLVRDLTGRHDPMGALCRYLLWLGAAAPPHWQTQARETVRLLVLTFLTEPAAAEPEPSTLPEPVLAMMRAIRRRWSDGRTGSIQLSELAAAARVSPSTLCRVFRRRFAIGPVAAVELLRLAGAEPLLWQSNLSMRAIAVQCGFADAYHFSRRFRAVYGMSPTAFRAATPETAPPSPVESAGLAALQALLPA